MRWFFLLFLVLAALVTNMAVFEKLNASRALAGVALNLVLLGVLGIWWSAYWLADQRQVSGMQYAISLLLLGCGLGLGQHTMELIVANECPSSSERRARLLSKLFNALIDAGYCKAVLAAYLLMSVSLVLLSVRTVCQARRGAYG